MSCLTVPNSCRETSQKRQLSHPASGSLLCRFSCSIWSTSDRDLQLRRDVPLEEQGSWNIFCKSESSWIWPPPLTVSEAFVSVHAPLCQKFSWGLEWNCAGADPYSLWRHCEGSTGAGGGGGYWAVKLTTNLRKNEKKKNNQLWVERLLFLQEGKGDAMHSFLRSITEQEEGVLASLRWLQPPRKRTNVNLWSLLFWLQPQKGDEITPKFCG